MARIVPASLIGEDTALQQMGDIVRNLALIEIALKGVHKNQEEIE